MAHSWNVKYLPLKNWANLEHTYYFCAEFLEEVRYLTAHVQGNGCQVIS